MDGSETRGYPVLVFLHSLLSCCPGRWCFTSHNQQEEKTETAWTERSALKKGEEILCAGLFICCCLCSTNAQHPLLIR